MRSIQAIILAASTATAALAAVAAPARADSDAYDCRVSQIRGGVRLDDVRLPPVRTGFDRQDLALADTDLVASVWTYVGLVGIEIGRADGSVLAQSRTAETGFSHGELWHYPGGSEARDEAVWVICRRG